MAVGIRVVRLAKLLSRAHQRHQNPIIQFHWPSWPIGLQEEPVRQIPPQSPPPLLFTHTHTHLTSSSRVAMHLRSLQSPNLVEINVVRTAWSLRLVCSSLPVHKTVMVSSQRLGGPGCLKLDQARNQSPLPISEHWINFPSKPPHCKVLRWKKVIRTMSHIPVNFMRFAGSEIEPEGESR